MMKKALDRDGSGLFLYFCATKKPPQPVVDSRKRRVGGTECADWVEKR